MLQRFWLYGSNCVNHASDGDLIGSLFDVLERAEVKLPDADIGNVVSCLEDVGNTLCNRLQGDVVVVLMDIALKADVVVEAERILYLLAVSNVVSLSYDDLLTTLALIVSSWL